MSIGEFNEDYRSGYNAALRFYENHEAGLREKIRQLTYAVVELVKGGDHEGECDNEFCPGPCHKHLAAAQAREDAAQKILRESR